MTRVSDSPAVSEPTPVAPEEPPPLPALTLRDGLPELIETDEGLADYVALLAAGTGPVAVDTERASGYRYGQSAYLIQIRREGAGSALIDPRAIPGLPGLSEALRGPEWILHAASQDLPCLAELGLAPTSLFDTELAGRLLGMARVGLGPMVAEVLGMSLAKGHGAADWSRRPLPEAWLEYAALDVEVLIELREVLLARLEEGGKLGWAEQEFAAVRDAPPPAPRVDPWRRTSGIHKIRSRRGLALVEYLWFAREGLAQDMDTAPGRLLPDSSIAAVAVAQVRDAAGLRALKDFHGRGASRYQKVWVTALREAWALPEAELPRPRHPGRGPTPSPRMGPARPCRSRPARPRPQRTAGAGRGTVAARREHGHPRPGPPADVGATTGAGLGGPAAAGRRSPSMAGGTDRADPRGRHLAPGQPVRAGVG